MDKPLARPRLVLVEDHQDNLEAFSMLLGEKYTVFAYASAAEALEAINAAKPDVLVLDIGMQPVDGVQCLEAIRAMPGYHDIPAVASTGFARDVERQRFLDAGFQAVFVKPILDCEQLMAVIDRLVNSPAPSPGLSRTPPRKSALPTPSAAASHLDGSAAMTESGVGESGKTDGQRPA